MKRVAVLGSTGSIGASTLDVVSRHPDKLRVVGLAARSQQDKLAQQCAHWRPSIVSVWDEEKAQAFKRLAPDVPQVLSGLDGLIALATHPEVDILVVATSGSDALIPLVRAIQAGKRIALASKELLVMAGGFIMQEVRKQGTSLIPIDSEHAALFQCLQNVLPEQITKLTVTGSGGPLWGRSLTEMMSVTRADVLAHPRWVMGPKITVDSATLMNKGLELIEARWLFDVPFERLQVVIHPEALVHALLELNDGSVLAQMSPCDMRLPIQYALSFPERWETPFPRLDLTQLKPLHFTKPDSVRFPCLKLAQDAASVGGSACIVLNGANDVAVQAYLEERIPFADIPRVIAETLEQHAVVDEPSLKDTLEIDVWSRQTAQRWIQQWSMRYANR